MKGLRPTSTCRRANLSEAALAVHTRACEAMAAPAPTPVDTLGELDDIAVGTEVSFWGVLADVRGPSPSRGTDVYITLGVIDDSEGTRCACTRWAERSKSRMSLSMRSGWAELNLFHLDPLTLPSARVADIVLVKRVPLKRQPSVHPQKIATTVHCSQIFRQLVQRTARACCPPRCAAETTTLRTLSDSGRTSVECGGGRGPTPLGWLSRYQRRTTWPCARHTCRFARVLSHCIRYI